MKTSFVLVLGLIVALLAGCAVAPLPAVETGPAAANGVGEGSAAPELNLSEGCIEAFDPGIDYFPDKIAPDHAEGWSVAYHGHYKVLTLHNPWRGAQETFQYLLVQCGAPAPEGFDDTPTIEVPVRSVAALTSTVLPHLHQLGLLERLPERDPLLDTREPSDSDTEPRELDYHELTHEPNLNDWKENRS